MPEPGFQPKLTEETTTGRRGGFQLRDHNQLANRGQLSHFEIDDYMKRLYFSLNQTPSDPSIIQYFDFKQRGWEFVTGDGAAANQDITITVPDSFHNDDYDVLVTVLGLIAGADPTERSDATGLTTQIIASARVIDASTFDVRVEDATGANLPNGTRFLFSWVAWGTRRGN